MNCRRTACVANDPADRNDNDVGKQVLTISEVPRVRHRLEIRTYDAHVYTLRLGHTTPRVKLLVTKAESSPLDHKHRDSGTSDVTDESKLRHPPKLRIVARWPCSSSKEKA